MRKFTLKNYLSLMESFSNPSIYVITARGKDTGNYYIFKLAERNTMIVKKSLEDENGITTILDNIDNAHIGNDTSYELLTVSETTFTKTGEVYEETTINACYEIRAYIKLFRLLKERADFTFICDGKQQQCYYADGKVYYQQENNEDMMLFCENLYKLNLSHPGFEILYVNFTLDRYSYKEYLTKIQNIADKKHKRFIRYKPENRLEGVM